VSIQLEARHKRIVADLLRDVPVEIEILIFGSRVHGTPHRSSDLDICLKGNGPLDPKVLGDLEDRMRDSLLPFKVDLLDYARATPEFRAIVDGSSERWTA
jgi:predicted nucleotidyltransferase